MTKSPLPYRAARVIAWTMAALLVFAQALKAQSVSNGFWQAQSIYQIITDRFFDGDPSNNNADGNYDPSGHSGTSVHGGDFKGIEQKLDYIKALGATAIWISPIVVNANGEFHGYSGRDFYNVDPHWGNLAALQHMIQAAHARGLLVIDDIVVNHGADLIYSTNSGYANFLAPPSGYLLKYRNSSKTFAAPFDTFNFIYDASNNALTNLFHNNGAIQNFNDTNQVILGELSGLDDFRTESPYVRTQMAAIYNFWIGQAGFDGFRIDTTKHVDMGFWQSWCPAVHSYAYTNGYPNFFMFGEVFDSSESKCGSYTGTMGGGAFKQDSVLDYPLFFNIKNIFALANSPTQPIEDHYNSIAANYDPSAQMRLVTFLDNHDQPRFLNASGATTNRLKVALAFLYTSRGIPTLYYGTEQGFNGATDPFDREDMFAGQFKDGPSGVDSFNMTHPLFLLTAQLNNFRRLYPELQIGSHVNKWNDPNGPGLFAYARRLVIGGSTHEAFVVFNTSATSQTLTNRSTAFSAGTQIINLLNTNEVLTIQSGPQTPLIVVPGTSAKIFVALSDWKPLDPVVVDNFPAHDATAVPTTSAIVLQFSQPMDTNSVQAAFGTVPPTTGNFSWSPGRDTMTFRAMGGLPGLTNIIVRVTNSAVAAISSNAMFAPYQLQFHTAAVPADTIPPTVSFATPTNGTTISGFFLISGSASDNVGVQKVEIRFDGGNWTVVNGTTAWNYNFNSPNFLNGLHVIDARATDTSGNISDITSANVRLINVPGVYFLRLSAGNSSDVTDCNSNTWFKDKAYTFGDFGYSGGATGFVANTISGVCAQGQSLYQHERFSTDSGGVQYEFDCPEGIYEIALLNSETFWSGPGQRQFNVTIQGQQVLTNFDIYAAAGMNLPVTNIFTTAVSNSQLKVLFLPVVDNTRISGLQVRRIADVYSDTDGIPDWWRLAYFNHPVGAAADKSRGTDDADGDGVSNLTEFLNGTDPSNPSSFPSAPVFDINQIALTGSNIQIYCPSVTNWSYQLLGRDSLDTSSIWTNLGPALPGNGGELLFTDSIGPNGKRFYRVQAR
jgi:alpha-amylase